MIAVFLFYNQGIGKYRFFIFSEDFVHCALLGYEGDHCILFEIATTGFILRILQSNDVNKNLNAIKKLPMLSAFIAVMVKTKKNSNPGPSKGIPAMKSIVILAVLILVGHLTQSISLRS